MAAKRKTRNAASPRKKSAPKKSAKKATKGAARPARKKAPVPAGAARGGDQVERIQKLISVMLEAGAVEVEMEEAGTKLRVRLKEEHPPFAYPATAMSVPATAIATAPPAAVTDLGVAGDVVAEGGEVFKSPMLGTFYRAPAPEAEPFTRVGDQVGPDTTLCIIEAMKVMNEIKAEREFEILDYLVQNGDPVEYGQPLFLIRS